MRIHWFGLLIALVLLGPGWSETPRYLPVLCYHQINPKAPTEMTTTPELFRQQLNYLQSQGYTTVSLNEAELFLRGKLPATRVAKPVLLTFDDGYDGVFRFGYPELKKRKMRATTFLVVSQVNQRNHLTVKQIQEMSRSRIFEFGSHTYNLHIPIPESWDQGQTSAYAIESDLRKSRSMIEKWLAKPATALAWPYGHYDQRCLNLARRSGFKMVFTTDYGYNLPGSGPWQIRRIRLSSEYDTVERLISKLATGG